MTMLTVDFTKLAGNGNALGHLDGKAWFAAGLLPGETAEVEAVKETPTYGEAVVRRITHSAPERGTLLEAHGLACSPWQAVDYAVQARLKTAMIHELFGRPGLDVPAATFVPATQPLGYRNKLEFSLHATNRQLELAFHERNAYARLTPAPTGCVLGSAAMNQAALALVGRLNQLNVAGYVETLTVRQSQSTGAVLGHVALHQSAQRDWASLQGPELATVVVSRLRGRGRYEPLWQSGPLELPETVGGVGLTYPYDGFFQTNLPMFETVLADVLQAVPTKAKTIDMYGGSGSIGLALAKRHQPVTNIEIDGPSVTHAQATAQRLGFKNYVAVRTPAERLDPALLAGAEAVVLDPPRAGLQGRVAEALVMASPARIVYVSCNPVTQVRDLARLSSHYRITSVTGYDMYPSTLHLETMVVLDRR